MCKLSSDIFELSKLPNPTKALKAAKTLLALADEVNFKQNQFIT